MIWPSFTPSSASHRLITASWITAYFSLGMNFAGSLEISHAGQSCSALKRTNDGIGFPELMPS